MSAADFNSASTFYPFEYPKNTTRHMLDPSYTPTVYAAPAPTLANGYGHTVAGKTRGVKRTYGSNKGRPGRISNTLGLNFTAPSNKSAMTSTPPHVSAPTYSTIDTESAFKAGEQLALDVFSAKFKRHKTGPGLEVASESMVYPAIEETSASFAGPAPEEDGSLDCAQNEATQPSTPYDSTFVDETAGTWQQTSGPGVPPVYYGNGVATPAYPVYWDTYGYGSNNASWSPMNNYNTTIENYEREIQQMQGRIDVLKADLGREKSSVKEKDRICGMLRVSMDETRKRLDEEQTLRKQTTELLHQARHVNHVYLSLDDQVTSKDILDLIGAINWRVEHIATLLISSTTHNKGFRVSLIKAEWLKLGMAKEMSDKLGTSPQPEVDSLMGLAAQACLSRICYDYLQEWGGHKFLKAVYEKMQENEHISVAGAWRILGMKAATAAFGPQMNLKLKIADQLPRMLVLGKRVANIEAGKAILKESSINQRIDELVADVLEFEAKTIKSVKGRGYKPWMVPPGSTFERDSMEDIEQNSEDCARQVLCTCALGVEVEERGVREGVFQDKKRPLLMPKVVVTGTWGIMSVDIVGQRPVDC